MDKSKLLIYLKQQYGNAVKHSQEFNPSGDRMKNESALKSFSENILSILDYIFNDFPDNDNEHYCPRPDLNKSKSEYIKKINEQKNHRKVKGITSKLHKVLLFLYDVNQKNEQAISLIPAGIKHKIGKTMEPEYKQRSQLTFYPNTTYPISANPHDGKSGFVIRGKNFSAKDLKLTINTKPNPTIYHLPDIESHTIFENVTLNGKKVNAVTWLKNCLHICDELIKKIE